MFRYSNIFAIYLYILTSKYIFYNEKMYLMNTFYSDNALKSPLLIVIKGKTMAPF